MRIPRHGSITASQLNYIEILKNDLVLSLKGRNFLINEIAGREVAAPDELTIVEASKVIEKFKEMKDAQKSEKHSENAE